MGNALTLKTLRITMSRFINNRNIQQSDSFDDIDFNEAVRLPDGGSTCETYRTKWHRHEVFVKRLKKEFRTNPLYLDALDKEYEIGVNLKHPSLPDYREFHRDYIVMDFIDGHTLASMIKNNDPWLRNEKNIIRLLKELVNVVDYLHRHNVTHCDIKPDNIMITANNKNLVLIDLDKCYTDALNDTSGDPSKYGLVKSHEGKITIDFHGIGRIVNLLKEKVSGFKFSRYSTFIKECNKEEPSVDDLLQILDYKPGNPARKLYWMVSLAPFIVALLYGGVLLLLQGKNGYEDNYGISDPDLQKDTLNTISTERQAKPENEDENREESHILKRDMPARTQDQIHAKAQEMAIILDKRIQPYFNELNLSLDSIKKMRSDPQITSNQLATAITRLMDKEDEYCAETFEILKEIYPGITDREAWRVMAYSKAYTGYKQRASKILSP